MVFPARGEATSTAVKELDVALEWVESSLDKQRLAMVIPSPSTQPLCRRPFVEVDEEFEKRPFGAPGLGEFIASQPKEATVIVVSRCDGSSLPCPSLQWSCATFHANVAPIGQITIYSTVHDL